MASQRSRAIGTSRTSNNRKSGPGISRGLSSQAVIEAAETIIARQGLATFRIRDVAELLDVQSQAIYNYFDGREALIEAVSESFTREVVEAMTVPEAKDLWDEVRLSARNLASFLCFKPSAAYLILADMAQWTLSQTGLAREMDISYQRHISEVLAKGADEGIFRPIRAAAYLSYLTSGIAANVLWNDRHRALRDGTAVSESIIRQEAVDLVESLLMPRISSHDVLTITP